MGSSGGAVDPVEAGKPHVVLLTMPAPGHMFPFIALGKALAQRGVKVTCLSSGVMSEKLQREVEEDPDVTLMSVVEDPLLEPLTPRNLRPWLFNLGPDEMVDRTVKLMHNLSPPPCLLIVDVFMSCSADIGRDISTKLSIPGHYFITMSAASLAYMFSVPLLAKQGLVPMDRTNAPSEFDVLGVGNLAQKDMWECFIKDDPMQSDDMIPCFQFLTESSPTATCLINSVEALEPEIFQALKGPIPFTGQVAKVVPIGPLETAFASKADCDIVSLEWVESKKKNEELASEVMQWLDAQPAASVVYVAFGSLNSPTEEQIRELALALEASGQRFLWIFRLPEAPQVRVSQQGPAVQEQITAILPPEIKWLEIRGKHVPPSVQVMSHEVTCQGFEERTKGRGLLYSSWAPQPRILAHKAVGCFVSHCGWNSLLEAIASCTPVLACPCAFDQWLNATFVEKRFRIGRVMKDERREFYERGQIESMLRCIMTDGDEERRNVTHLNKLMREAVTSSTGSSSSNLQDYVADIFALNRQLHSRVRNGFHP